MTIIKEIVDCMLDENLLLDWAHKELVEIQTFAKRILGKVPNFELFLSLQSFMKKCTKLVSSVKFVDGFDFTSERHN